MKRNIGISIVAAVFFIGGAPMGGFEGSVFGPPVAWAMDPLNAAYIVEGKEVRLIDGYHEEQAAPGSATKIKTWFFGKPAYGDLDGDGDEDAALFLIQDPGGSGTFYYAAAALRKSGIYRGTNSVFLGDRISPRTIKIQKGVIIVEYADRRPDESMAASPSVVKDKYLAVKNGRLEEMKK